MPDNLTSPVAKNNYLTPESRSEKIAIAPMIDWSDRHYRYFMRQITQQTTLYTEMVVADAIIYGNRDKLLEFNGCEQPLVAQLGGCDPAKLAQAARICQDYGYSEINLNLGCPSERVQSGSFGACLMREPDLVAECIAAMRASVALPVSVKQRIGLDYSYDYELLATFVARLKASGCTKFIVHARNAVLKGLSPKENREIPPLRYDFVYRLKQDFPELTIMLNGGIKTTSDIATHLEHVDSVMLGREAYSNPFLFADFDHRYAATRSDLTNGVASAALITRKQVAQAMIDYLEATARRGGRLHHVTRHMLGLYHGRHQAKFWRQQLTTQIIKSNQLSDYINLVEQMDE